MLFLLILISFFFSCDSEEGPYSPDSYSENAAGNALFDNNHIEYTEDENCRLRRKAARIADALDDRQLAAQVIITGIDGRGRLTHGMRTLLTEFPTGGIMLFRFNLNTGNDEIRNLIAEASDLIASGVAVTVPSEETDGEELFAAIRPFVAADQEGGVVSRFMPGVADLPPPLSYWEAAQNIGKDAAIAQVKDDSYRAGRVIFDLGVNMNFAPVAEHLHEHNTDFLQSRSYGPDPDFAAAASAAFITGMEMAGVICVAKHFPGSAGIDPHYHPSLLPGDKEAMAEFAAPFEYLIRNGYARSIMISHSAIPAWDTVNIASLSPAVMDIWLRQELGFEGIIICDDFLMAAARNPFPGSTEYLTPETAAVRSLAAGADMVMVWPSGLRQTHAEIRSALDDGRLTRERLRDASARIILEKLRMRLIDNDT